MGEKRTKEENARISNAPSPTTSTDAVYSTTCCFHLSRAMPLGFVPPQVYGALGWLDCRLITFASKCEVQVRQVEVKDYGKTQGG